MYNDCGPEFDRAFGFTPYDDLAKATAYDDLMDAVIFAGSLALTIILYFAIG